MEPKGNGLLQDNDFTQELSANWNLKIKQAAAL
jgi:hypothetical protein